MSKIIDEDIKRIVEELGEDSKRFSGKTVLITGGAGFLGKFFISYFDCLNKTLLDSPCKVISVDNFVTGVAYPISESDTFISI